MNETDRWRTGGVRVVRAAELRAQQTGPGGSGRATIFDFAGSGGRETWIGHVVLPPAIATGAHHHGRHEVAFYVLRGRSEVRWGPRLEYAAEVGPGDFAYFPPFVPHQERNLSDSDTLELLVVRSDNERIAVPLDEPPVEHPETVY